MRLLALASPLLLVALHLVPAAAAHHVPYPGNAVPLAIESYRKVDETQPLPDLVDTIAWRWLRCVHYHLDCIPIQHDCAPVLADITYNAIGWLWSCTAPD